MRAVHAPPAGIKWTGEGEMLLTSMEVYSQVARTRTPRHAECIQYDALLQPRWIVEMNVQRRHEYS